MMPMHSWPNSSRFALAGLTVFAASFGSARTLHADDKQACLEAYDKAQTMRQEDKLVAAREQLLTCARNVCPSILRKDCTTWLSEVDASMPTVVLSVRDAKGADLVDVKVTVDGEPFVTQIDGKAVPVDPGVHTFRFEVDGSEPVEERIVIHAAAKNRGITIKLGGDEVPTGGGTTGGGATTGGTVDTGEAGGPPVLAYVFGGVGLVGLGAFTYFGTQFDSKLNDMDACKPNCTQSDADDASSTRTMAYVSAGVGVVSLGVATYLFLSAPSGEEVSTEVSSLPHVDLMPVRGGAVGSFGARF